MYEIGEYDSYPKALAAAGATIIAYDSFGSYQGDWLAKIEYNGVTGWVHGYYGSCSGCDAFEAEFGCLSAETTENLAEFGRKYLDDIMTHDAAIATARKNIEWDSDAEEMLKFVEANA